MKWTDILSLTAIASLVALAAFVYWNGHGVANGQMLKPTKVGVLVVLPILTFVLFKALPAISPRRARMAGFQHVTNVLTLALTLLLVGIGAAVLLAMNGRDVPVPFVFLVLIGGFFVVLGNYLGKVRRNYFVGIRTPWTLASDEVWARSHRFGGWVFMIAGFVLITLAWRAARAPFFMIASLLAVLVTASVVTVVHSYVVYRRLHGPDALDRPG